MAERIITSLELRGQSDNLIGSVRDALTSLKALRAELRGIKSDLSGSLKTDLFAAPSTAKTKAAINDVARTHKRAEEQKRVETKKTSAQQSDVLRQQRRQLTETARLVSGGSTLGGGRNFIERIGIALGIGAGATGVFGLLRSFNELLKDTINSAGEFQRLETSFVSILLQGRSVGTDRIPSAADIQAIGAESVRLFRESQLAAIQTVASTKEYVSVLQTALAVGQQVGLSQGEVEKITKRLVLAAGAFGIEFGQLGSSIAQILAGTVRVTNQLGRNLGLATAEQRKQLRLAIEQGKLFEFLEVRTRAFGQTAKQVENNFINVRAAVRDIFEVGGTEAVAPLFKFLNDELIKFRDRFIGDNENQIFTPALQRIIKGFQQFFADIIPSIRVLINEFGNFLRDVGQFFGGGAGLGLVKGLLAGFTAILKLIRDIVSFRGFGALIVIVTAVNLGLRLIFALLSRISAQAALFAANMRNAAVAGNATAAALNRAAIATRLSGIATVLTTLAVGFSLLSSRADDSVEAIDRVNKSIQNTNDQLQKQIQNASVLNLLKEFEELANIPTNQRSEDQLKRLVELGNLLEEAFENSGKAFDDSARKIVQSGRLTEEVQRLALAQTQRNTEELQKQLEFSREFVKSLESLATIQRGSDPISRILSITDFTDPTRGARIAAENNAVQELKKRIKELGDSRGIETKAILENADALQAELEGRRAQLDLLENSIKSLQQEQVSIRDTIALASAQAAQLKEKRELVQQGLSDSRLEAQVLAEIRDLETQQAVAISSVIEKARQKGKVTGETTEVVLTGLRKEIEALLQLVSVQELNNAQTREAAKAKLQEAQANIAAAITIGDVTKAIEEQNKAQALTLALQGTDPEAFRKDLEQRIAIINSALGTIRTGRATGAGDKKGRGRERDVLADFLRTIDRQRGIIKSISDLIEKETDRISDNTRRALRELGTVGAIPFEDAIERERRLIIRAGEINAALTEAQADFVEANEALAKKVAEAQQARDKKRDKTGTDIRDREIERLERQRQQTLQILEKRLADSRKVENELTELARFATNERINLRRAELEFQKEFTTSQADFAARAAAARNRVGLITSEEALRAEFTAGKTARDERRKELLLLFNPFADEEFQRLLDESLKDFGAKSKDDLISFIKNQSEEDFADLEARVDEANKLIEKITEINKKLTDPKRKTKDDASLVDDRIALEKQLDETIRKIGVQAGQEFTIKQITGLASFLELLSKLEGTREEKIKALGELYKLQIEDAEALLDLGLKLRDVELDRLEVQQRFIESDSQRLDLLEQVLTIQRESGELTERQARREEALIVQRRIEQARLLQQNLRRRLATETANLGADPAANAQVALRQLEIVGQLKEVNAKLFELQTRAFELQSPLIAAARGFRQVGDAIGQIDGPVGKLKGVFDGLANLADALANRGRPKSPGEEILESAKGIKDAGSEFKFDIGTSRNIWVDGVTKSVQILNDGILKLFPPGTSSGGGRTNSGGISLDPFEGGIEFGDLGNITGAAKETKKTLTDKIAGLILDITKVAADLITSIASGDKGAIVGAVGRAISLIPGGKIIGAVVETVGGIISFFGARARQKTREMAESISKGIRQISTEFNRGSISLGKAIRDIESRVEDARRRLSGRKGGREALSEIEEEAAAELERLRERQREIQRSFREDLKLLRQDEDLRDLDRQTRDIKKRVKEFLDSFENQADAAKAMKQAAEFLELSLKDLTDDIKRSIEDLAKSLQEATENFKKQERDILLEGRIQPEVSAAISKRDRLIELKREFDREVESINRQIEAENKKLDFVNKRLDVERIIANLAERSAEQLGLAADRLLQSANAIERVFRGLNGLPFGATNLVSGGQSFLIVDLRVNGQEVGRQTIGVGVKKHIQLAAQISPSRQLRFNPVEV